MDSSHNIDLKISEMPKVINLQICFQLQEPKTLNLQNPEPVNLQDTKHLNLQHAGNAAPSTKRLEKSPRWFANA